MLELIEEQVNFLNKDEQSLGENLDFIGRSMEAIVLSRTDTFKEHIVRAYVAKEEELEHYKKRCEDMEGNDAHYKSIQRDREDMHSKNMKLRDELDDVREKSVMESIALRKNI